MKKILFFLISFVCLHYAAVAQEPSSILTLGGDKLYSYEKVFEAPGKTKEQIFDALKSWIIKTVKSQSNTNYFDETGKGTVSTTISYPVAFNSTVDFKLNIDIKEGKYKVTAASFIWQNMQGIQKTLGDYKGINTTKKSRMKTLEDVDEGFKKMLSAIEEAIAKDAEW